MAVPAARSTLESQATRSFAGRSSCDPQPVDQRIVTAATKKQKAAIAAHVRNVSSRSHLSINARHSVGGEAGFQLRTASLMGTVPPSVIEMKHTSANSPPHRN